MIRDISTLTSLAINVIILFWYQWHFDYRDDGLIYLFPYISNAGNWTIFVLGII